MSRSRLEIFINCPRCFYLEYRLGIKRPSGYPYTLNLAVDKLLKKEFDIYRKKQSRPPLLIDNNIEAIPFLHYKFRQWQDLRQGITFLVPNTNILLSGSIDDVWLDTKTKELIIVDYKATSSRTPVSIDAPWKNAYKRQLEVYQWLFRKNGFAVSNTAYFVYCNASTNARSFENRLEFDISFIPHSGNTNWVETAVIDAYSCLNGKIIPAHKKGCNYCKYNVLNSKLKK